jgi:F0F1-type ATP synthase assembly protein I
VRHLPAILIIMGTLAVWAFYALFAVARLVLAISFVLGLLHRLLKRITESAR